MNELKYMAAMLEAYLNNLPHGALRNRVVAYLASADQANASWRDGWKTGNMGAFRRMFAELVA